MLILVIILIPMPSNDEPKKIGLTQIAILLLIPIVILVSTELFSKVKNQFKQLKNDAK